MTNTFHHEDEIAEAYDGAEFILRGLIQQDIILIPDYREPAKSATIRRAARAIADAVIRSGATFADSGDITTVPGVKLEIVRS
jgi:hypothetical protein